MFTARRLIKSPSQPAARDRTLTCTHTQMTREFDHYACQTCSVCNSKSALGWLYRCVQDHEGFLPASDFYDVHDTKRFDLDAQLYTLSPSIVRAAELGQYTDEQLATLWKQKLEVRKAIRQVRPATSSASSIATSSQYSLPVSTTASSLRSSETDADTDTTQATDSVSPCQISLEPIKELYEGAADEPLSFAKATATPPCNFRVCQICRPIYQQRAWQSLNEAIISPYRPPPNHELSNRRFSDVRLVRQLGLRHDNDPDSHGAGSCEEKATRDGRAQFQAIVGQLLRAQGGSSSELPGPIPSECGYELKRVPAVHDLQNSLEMNNNATIFARRTATNSGLFRPLIHRKVSDTTFCGGSDQKMALRQVKSDSMALSRGGNHQLCPSVIGLKIDTVRANADIVMHEPKRTPTESIRERVYRLRDIAKPSPRSTSDQST